MAKPLATDINSKSVYLRMINKARGELTILTKKLDRTLNAKKECYNYLLARKGDIANELNINLDDYDIEFNKQLFNENLTLQTKVFKLLKKYNDTQNRTDIIQLAKWCSILKNEYEIGNKMLICNTKYNMPFSEFREYLFKYYSKVQEILLKGHSYKFGNGIGTIYLKLVKLSNNKTRIDFQKTKAAKEKLINEGKTPYRKEDAEYAKLMGIEYDGVPYIVEQERSKEVVFNIKNSKFFTSRRVFDFKVADYVNAKYRNMSYKEIAENFVRKESDIYPMQLGIKRKLHILELINPGIYQRYIREK